MSGVLGLLTPLPGGRAGADHARLRTRHRQPAIPEITEPTSQSGELHVQQAVPRGVRTPLISFWRVFRVRADWSYLVLQQILLHGINLVTHPCRIDSALIA